LKATATLRRFTEAVINGGKPMPREEIRDNMIPFHLGVNERSDGLGTWVSQYWRESAVLKTMI
jgi:hypothetical protein